MRTLALLAATLASLSAMPAQALTNGSFESVFSGWSTLGDVSPYDELVSDGYLVALIGTASVDQADDRRRGFGHLAGHHRQRRRHPALRLDLRQHRPARG